MQSRPTHGMLALSDSPAVPLDLCFIGNFVGGMRLSSNSMVSAVLARRSSRWCSGATPSTSASGPTAAPGPRTRLGRRCAGRD